LNLVVNPSGHGIEAILHVDRGPHIEASYQMRSGDACLEHDEEEEAARCGSNPRRSPFNLKLEERPLAATSSDETCDLTPQGAHFLRFIIEELSGLTAEPQ